MLSLPVPGSAILDAIGKRPGGDIMDTFTCEELQAIYLSDEGLLSLCDMLYSVSQEDWPQSQEDLQWLLWAFGAECLS
jgi:hypothetical protein